MSTAQDLNRDDEPGRLVLMRGASGSGKSTTAKSLGGLVLSADDFHIQPDGRYKFDKQNNEHAHRWNQERAEAAMLAHEPLIVVDNTFSRAARGRPYAILAEKHGYAVEIREPDNDLWRSFRPEMEPLQLDALAEALAARGRHGVPAEAIRAMLERWEHGLTPGDLLPRGSAAQTDAPEVKPARSSAPVEPTSPLEAVRMAGEAQFTATQTEELIGRPMTEEERAAYLAACRSVELRVRRAVIKLALQGSSPAQTLALGFVEARRNQERGRPRR